MAEQDALALPNGRAIRPAMGEAIERAAKASPVHRGTLRGAADHPQKSAHTREYRRAAAKRVSRRRA